MELFSSNWFQKNVNSNDNKSNSNYDETYHCYFLYIEGWTAILLKSLAQLGAPFSRTECIPNKHCDDLQSKVTKRCRR